MSVSPLQRMEIYRQVRVVLVRHLIDIGRLSIQISMQHLQLHGSLCRLPGVTTAFTPEIIYAIFGELGRIKGIRKVDGDFDNWRQVDGTTWVAVETPKMVSPPMKTPSSQVFEIKGEKKPSQPAG
jgi:hypothetical protein